MKHTFITAISLASLALAACSNDELVQESTLNSNEIRFSVVSDPASRAMTSYYYTGLNNPDAFYVCANIGGDVSDANYGNTYISHELQQKQSGSTFYTNADGARFWPNDGTKLNFYAHYNALNSAGNAITPQQTAATDGKTTYTFSNVSLPEQEHNQRDFIYAAALDQTKPTDNTGRVNLNFKHAFAQLGFRIMCQDPGLLVMVDRVTIYNVYREGSMTYGAESTSDKATQYVTNSRCTWDVADYKTDKQNVEKYVVDMNRGDGTGKFAYSYVYYNENGQSISISQDITPTIDNAGNTTGGLLVIPQEYEAWTPSKSGSWTSIADATTSASGVHQAYVGISCRIYNLRNSATKAVNSANFFEFDGTKLKLTEAAKALDPVLQYGGANGEFKEIVIPMPITDIVSETTDQWRAGRKYVYSFRIGTGSNGGYDPENGDPVLRAMSFTGSIVDWEVGEVIEVKQ
jgi:hypothetical protein